MSDYATLTDNLSTAYPETPTLSSYRTAISPLLHRIFSSIGLLATHTNAQIGYLTLVLAIKINEHDHSVALKCRQKICVSPRPQLPHLESVSRLGSNMLGKTMSGGLWLEG
jgi:hypothetical protein